MIDATPLLRLYGGIRAGRLARQKAAAVQQRTLRRLLRHAAATRFGRDHAFARLRDYRAFQQAVPLRRYEDFWSAYWQPAFPDLIDVSWPGRMPFFAASSGTSTGATKFIPVTWEMIRSNRQAGLDLLVRHLRQRPDSHVFGGRNLLLGGSTDLVERAPGVSSGDLSGIAAATLPAWARAFSYPPPDIARLTDWTEKMARLAEAAPQADVRSISGTPSWLLLFFDELVRRHPDRGARLADFFPKLELVIHGGVNFAPYRARFAEWLDGGRVETREVYAASEGFIALADRGEGAGLRVNLDNGIFYEFVPVAEIDAAQPTRHWIGDIETGVDYAPVLTTCAGLWAYIVGDLVRFIDREPPRLLVTGRLSYTLSAFGEHLTGEEIEGAVTAASQTVDAGVRDFSVGALYPEKPGEIGGHLFVVEFERGVSAEELTRFADALDRDLMRRNLDYGAHRAGGFGMRPPQILSLRQGGFAEWMRQRGRLGSQNKVPRVISDPALFAELCAFAEDNRQHTIGNGK
ncbi:MAG: GH3 auxin-responsive promoter family protein [Alphaproteobacteria bacterium]|nr:GH3 auxin-responsive promoter family protein [Alphaproteobacteria bacterium]